jgi:hypothetical protein
VRVAQALDFADHLDLALQEQQRFQPLTKERMVVGDD